MTGRVRRVVASIVVAIAVTVSTAACQQGSPDMSQRPPIGEVVDRYDATVAGLRDLVSTEYPDATWSQDGESSQGAGAAEGSVYVTSSIWYAEVPLADDASARDRLVTRADAIVRAHGFDDFSTVQAKPGDFSYVTSDEWGGELHLSGGKTVTIRYTTGQHPEH